MVEWTGFNVRHFGFANLNVYVRSVRYNIVMVIGQRKLL